MLVTALKCLQGLLLALLCTTLLSCARVVNLSGTPQIYELPRDQGSVVVIAYPDGGYRLLQVSAEGEARPLTAEAGQWQQGAGRRPPG
jgi:hypothetical protein